MVISNRILADSFKYSTLPLNERLSDIFDLSDILDYCNQINEKLHCDGDLMHVEVIEGITFGEWLFNRENDDIHQFFLTLYQDLIYDEKTFDKQINISLGEYADAVWNREMYVKERRSILSQIKSPSQYEKFMRSCFLESVFSESVTNELCHNVRNFSRHVEEITNNLAYLNDNAVRLHREHIHNIKEAVDIINSELRQCSDDPNHKEDLYFKFEYNKDGQTELKDILCSVHTKLVRPDSNLRIYFKWCDPDVGNENKVLIGLIGRHPY